MRAGSLFIEVRENIRGMRFNLSELSGSLGDLGTFIPLAVAISIANGMDIGAILLFAGLFNITTGILFGLPIPVQPMKAIAAVAIAEGLTSPETAAAGLCAGAIVLLLGATGMTSKLETVIPRSVVRGIQLGVGAKLFINGIHHIAGSPIWGLNSIAVAVLLIVMIAMTFRFAKFPSALVLFGVGLVFVFLAQPQAFSHMGVSLISLHVVLPNPHEWLHAFVYGSLPQVPLTLLNSVIAVCALAIDLFPKAKISTDRMAVSVGIMNLIGCWFGGMPVCHGSGGLAGQYRFGARTGGSVVMLGVAKTALGLFFGVSAMWLLSVYPLSILGVMLIFAGIELAKPALSIRTGSAIVVMLFTAAGIVVYNTLIGFLVGIALHMILKFRNISRAEA